MLNILPYVNSVPTMGEQVRGIRQDVANREYTETNTDIAKEKLLDIIQSRPYRQRIQAAEAEDAELRLGVNQKYLEDLMLNKAEQAKIANDLARERLDIQRQFGERQAEVELSAAENQADYYKNQLEMGPLKRKDLQSQINARKAQTQASYQQSLLYQAELAAARRQEQEDKVKQKLDTAYKVLSNTDRKDPQAVERAITMIARTPGVQLHEWDMQVLRNDPEGYFKYAQSVAVDADAQYRRQTDLLSHQQELARIRERGRVNLIVEQGKATLEGQQPVELKSHVREANKIALKNEIATEVYGDNSIVREDSDNYNKSVANTINEMVIRMQAHSEQSATNMNEYYNVLNQYKDRYVSIFKASKVMEGDVEVALENVPRTLDELLDFEREVESIDVPGSPLNRFKEHLAGLGPALEDNIMSADTFGRALGISDQVVDYMVGAALMKLREPKGE